MLEAADAAVLIGDPALELDRDRYEVLDLGAAWTEWTGLPFVYACWTGRAGTLNADARDLLVAARALGLAQVDAIAADYAAARSFPPEFYAAYLAGSLHFDFGDKEMEGLLRFLSYAAELNLIRAVPPIGFY